MKNKNTINFFVAWTFVFTLVLFVSFIWERLPKYEWQERIEKGWCYSGSGLWCWDSIEEEYKKVGQFFCEEGESEWSRCYIKEKVRIK